MVPVLVSVKSSANVAVCASPVPVKEKLLNGEPSDAGQEAPPPFVSVAVEVSALNTMLPFAAGCLPDVLVIVIFCVYLPSDTFFQRAFGHRYACGYILASDRYGDHAGGGAADSHRHRFGAYGCIRRQGEIELIGSQCSGRHAGE